VFIDGPNRLLPACVAVAGLLAVVACSTAPRRTSEERLADAELAAQVRSALRADRALYSPHIDVEVERGEVHLKGFVYSGAERQLAQRDAESVAGAQLVDMEIGIMGGGISAESSD
jgi:osmotically-inducible protein OsmY